MLGCLPMITDYSIVLALVVTRSPMSLTNRYTTLTARRPRSMTTPGRAPSSWLSFATQLCYLFQCVVRKTTTDLLPGWVGHTWARSIQLTVLCFSALWSVSMYCKEKYRDQCDVDVLDTSTRTVSRTTRNGQWTWRVRKGDGSNCKGGGG